METYKINNYTLEYDDESHTYIVDGVIVPSVTQIISAKFGNKYAGVDRSTLERAASRGTAIHKAIEDFCKTGKDDGTKELHNFNFLMTYYEARVVENEIPIIIINGDTPIAAGRLDLLLDINGDYAIADIKTTATLDKDYLTYQLNLYRLGYSQSYGILAGELYGVHLKNDKRKLVKIPVNEGIAWEIIDEYERGKA
jgi:hypothetical protein